MTVLRWILFLPASFVGGIAASFLLRMGAFIFPEIIRLLVCGAGGAAGMVYCGLYVAPRKTQVVKWILIVLAALVGLLSALGAFPKVSSSLSILGYTDNGDQGIKDRIAFKRKDDTVPYCTPTREWINHHLYVCPSYSQELLRHIIFRDYLLRDTTARREYAKIKKEIEAESDGDRKKYALIKETRARAFVEGTLIKARVTNRWS